MVKVLVDRRKLILAGVCSAGGLSHSSPGTYVFLYVCVSTQVFVFPAYSRDRPCVTVFVIFCKGSWFNFQHYCILPISRVCLVEIKHCSESVTDFQGSVDDELGPLN